MAQGPGKDLYKVDGVNIDAGDAFSKFAGKLAQETYKSSVFVEVTDLSKGNFRGPRGYVLRGLPKGYIETGVMDGIGTKVVVIDAAGNFQDAASNLVAMTAMDITRWGGLPLVFLNILDVASLGEVGSKRFEQCQDLMYGLWNIAKAQGYVMLTGETAELGKCVGSENPDPKVTFNWGGAMLGVYHPDKMIRGDKLAPGQKVIVLRDSFRSNGISSVRKALAMKYGPEWWKNPAATPEVLAAAAPSALYDRMLNRANGWFNWGKKFAPEIEVRLIVHLSGGAFESKLGLDILQPLGLTAELPNLFAPSDIMRKCAEWRGMGEEECYRTWNGGQGALVVVDEKDVQAFLDLAAFFSIEAQVAGDIVKGQGYNVAIRSQFGSGKLIQY